MPQLRHRSAPGKRTAPLSAARARRRERRRLTPARETMLDRTGNRKAVQKLLGHASIQTTADIYTDWDVEQLIEAVRDE